MRPTTWPYVILNYGTFSRTRYHMSALLNADITMDDGPYSIMLTHHYSVRHALTMAQNGAVTDCSLAGRFSCLTPN